MDQGGGLQSVAGTFVGHPGRCETAKFLIHARQQFFRCDDFGCCVRIQGYCGVVHRATVQARLNVRQPGRLVAGVLRAATGILQGVMRDVRCELLAIIFCTSLTARS